MRARREIDSISDRSNTGIEITVVAGGADRIESVQRALKLAGTCDIVLVHDCARALTPPDVFRRVADGVRAGAEAVVPVLAMTDTVRRAVSANDADPTPASPHNQSQPEVLRGDLDRTSLRRIQTPQGFTSAVLRRAHEHCREEMRSSPGEPGEAGEAGVFRGATDDAGLVERLGIDVIAVDGDEEALKITYPLDLVLGEHIAKIRDEMNERGAKQ